MSKLNEYFDWLASGKGIFYYLQQKNVPWKSENINEDLDLEYHGNVSGDKSISPLFGKLLVDDEMTEARKGYLADVIFSVYGKTWTKEWNTLSASYNPIENYSMKETMTDDETVTTYGKTHTKTGTETEAPNVTDTRTPNTVISSETGVYGFNSSEAVPSGTGETSNTGTDTTVRTGTDTMTYNTSDADTGSNSNVRNYELERAGNIGVTTSQQMLEAEQKLWMWNFFRTVAFPDIDRILTIEIYD